MDQGFVERYPCDCHKKGICWIVRHPKLIPAVSYSNEKAAKSRLTKLRKQEKSMMEEAAANRKLEEKFRDLLQKWNPGQVQFHSFKIDPDAAPSWTKELVLRITNPNRCGFLEIRAANITDIQCSATWESSNLEIYENCSGWLITDFKAKTPPYDLGRNYLIQAECVEVEERGRPFTPNEV